MAFMYAQQPSRSRPKKPGTPSRAVRAVLSVALTACVGYGLQAVGYGLVEAAPTEDGGLTAPRQASELRSTDGLGATVQESGGSVADLLQDVDFDRDGQAQTVALREAVHAKAE
jgi:hypothetical protein